MLINLSNHPSTSWSSEQLAAAASFGQGIIDITFPQIPPSADEEFIKQTAGEYFQKIFLYKDSETPLVVHIMGEMTFCFALVAKLKEQGIRCVASTTERHAIELDDGAVLKRFRFVRFREYV